ncbi:MAG: hypothetical protein CMP81_08400 [Fulvimarina sp.]|nr:hypothetical protein [Fulvimarina sp.]
MGFDFSAMTALLGGYADSRQRPHDYHPGERRQRGSWRQRPAPGSEAGSRDASADAAADASDAAPRLALPPVTGGAPGQVGGVGRALDALIAAEETRRRKTPPESAAKADHCELSSVLKASLPPRRPAPQDAAPARAPAAATTGGGRDWGQIRDLIEALAKADRPSVAEQARSEPLADARDTRPWRPRHAP